jgi:hypothetical protein
MQLIILWNSVQTIEEIFNLTIVNKKKHGGHVISRSGKE